jgi:hypothetical protein
VATEPTGEPRRLVADAALTDSFARTRNARGQASDAPGAPCTALESHATFVGVRRTIVHATSPIAARLEPAALRIKIVLMPT